jgi:hypothetical protein
MKYSAEPRLPMMRMNAMATMMCMKPASRSAVKSNASIIAPQSACRVGEHGFPV